MAFTTLKSLNAEIKLLEAQKKLVEKRDGDVPSAISVLHKYAKVLTAAQRRQIAKIVGGDDVVVSPSGRGRASAKRKAGNPVKVAPKYRLPSGETWTGRGRSPRAFAAWAKSAEGKAWAKANPTMSYPLAAEDAVAPSRKRVVPKDVKKGVTKKAVKKVQRKASKKPAG